MKSFFSNLYESFKKDNIKVKDVIKQTNKLKSGFFYSIIQTSDTEDVFNCNPVCLCIGPSEKDKYCYNVIDLCYMTLNLRYKFCELFFNSYKDQINDRMFDSDSYKDIDNFNLKFIQSFLKVFNISPAITKIHLKDVKKINVIDFVNVAAILRDIDNVDNFKNTSMKKEQLKSLAVVLKK